MIILVIIAIVIGFLVFNANAGNKKLNALADDYLSDSPERSKRAMDWVCDPKRSRFEVELFLKRAGERGSDAAERREAGTETPPRASFPDKKKAQFSGNFSGDANSANYTEEISPPIKMTENQVPLTGSDLEAGQTFLDYVPEVKASADEPDVKPLTERRIRKCPACRQNLHLPANRRGTVKCPKCAHDFYADTFTA